MDFNKYNNINDRLNKFGGVKKTMFNKKKFKEAEKSWENFTPKELKIIDKEFLTAPQVYLSIVTSEAICIYNNHTFTAIPIKDILWIYGKKELIRTKYAHLHSYVIKLLSRNGQTYELGRSQVLPGHSGKNNEEGNAIRIEQIRSVLYKHRKGIIYDYNKEICDLFINNFEKAVEMVDNNSKNTLL